MTQNEDCYELFITRIFDAPPEQLYDAFVDPDQFAEWFGPLGWRVPRETVEVDPRPGGRDRFVVVDTENRDTASEVDGQFVDVVENELLVATQAVRHPGRAASPPETSTLRVEFHGAGGHRSRLDVHQGPYTEEHEAQARQDWEGAFGKLDELLAAR